VNFEHTFESAKILANEIVKRFNQKEKQGGCIQSAFGFALYNWLFKLFTIVCGGAVKG
jgi:nucleoside 2-deoxyribosyltransferase